MTVMEEKLTKRQQEARDTFPYDGVHGAFVNAGDVMERYGEAHPGKPMPPYISYRVRQSGRAYQSAAWQVIRRGFKTDDVDGYWRDNGHKTFDIFSRDMKEPQLEAAKAWAGERYGVTEWKKTNRIRVTGVWLPAFVVDWLEETIKQHKK